MVGLGSINTVPEYQAPRDGAQFLPMPRKPRPPRPLPDLSQPAPPPTGQAAAFQSALDQQIIKALGAIPLLLPVFERLGLRQIINSHLEPSGAEHDPGLVVLILCLNRLLAPRPLVHVETWLADTALPEILGLAPDTFNDDRLARSLDALAPHLEAIWQELAIQAIIAFDLDLSQLCYDITSVSFTGAYEQAELVRYGYSRDHRPDRKQVNLALDVTVDGAMPIDYRVLAGNTADSTTPADNLNRLRELLSHLAQADPSRPPIAPLFISDRAMLTPESMFEYDRHQVHFLGPYDAGDAGKKLLSEVSGEELASHPLEYRPQRAERDPSWQPYQGVLRTLEITHPDDAARNLCLQVLVVWSPAKARLDAQLRQKNLERLEASLTHLQGKLNHRPYSKAQAAQKRLNQLLSRHPARPYLEVGLAGQDGELTLCWQRRQETIEEAAKVDGRYLLATNDRQLEANEMLRLSKRRDLPEKRFSTVKGVLEVRPVYVHKQERVLGLVFCTMVALLAYALIELECQRAAVPRTTRAIFAEFAPIAMVVTRFADGSSLRRISGVSPGHQALLEALDLPPFELYTISNC
jgi:transposase